MDSTASPPLLKEVVNWTRPPERQRRSLYRQKMTSAFCSLGRSFANCLVAVLLDIYLVVLFPAFEFVKLWTYQRQPQVIALWS